MRRSQESLEALDKTLPRVEWKQPTVNEKETKEFGMEPYNSQSGTVTIGRLIGTKGLDFSRSCTEQVTGALDDVKWGDVQQSVAVGGLKELRDAMDEHEKKLPRMLEMIKESRAFLHELDQEEAMKIMTEGLAHAEATVEEATHYLKHFDR